MSKSRAAGGFRCMIPFNIANPIRGARRPVVKRLQRTEAGWQLVSDNRAYKPVPWPRDAQVLGQVMWTGRTL